MSSQVSAKAGPKQHSISMCILRSLCFRQQKEARSFYKNLKNVHQNNLIFSRLVQRHGEPVTHFTKSSMHEPPCLKATMPLSRTVVANNVKLSKPLASYFETINDYSQKWPIQPTKIVSERFTWVLQCQSNKCNGASFF